MAQQRDLTRLLAAVDGGSARPGLRPLGGCSRNELLDGLEHALAAAQGFAGAHCVHELWMRGEPAMVIEAALDRLWERASETVPDWLPMRHVTWLPAAYEVAAGIDKPQSGRTHIYLVLLDYADRSGDPHGVYVGMTRHAPSLRFDQHKAGIRAAGSVLKRGLELLPGPVMHLQWIARGEAIRIEAQLAEALADAGIRVRGGH